MSRLAPVEFVYSKYCENRKCPWKRIYWNPVDKKWYEDAYFETKVHKHLKA